jgi:hypothetical protein
MNPCLYYENFSCFPAHKRTINGDEMRFCFAGKSELYEEIKHLEN